MSFDRNKEVILLRYDRFNIFEPERIFKDISIFEDLEYAENFINTYKEYQKMRYELGYDPKNISDSITLERTTLGNIEREFKNDITYNENCGWVGSGWWISMDEFSKIKNEYEKEQGINFSKWRIRWIDRTELDSKISWKMSVTLANGPVQLKEKYYKLQLKKQELMNAKEEYIRQHYKELNLPKPKDLVGVTSIRWTFDMHNADKWDIESYCPVSKLDLKAKIIELTPKFIESETLKINQLAKDFEQFKKDGDKKVAQAELEKPIKSYF